MSIDLINYESKTREAIQNFWINRNLAKLKQTKLGTSDQGERGAVTDGKNMNGFINLIIHIIHANGLPDAEIHQKKNALTLPGFFRPTKSWDLIVTYKGELVAAIEFKSQVGPSFGNNFNNRAEEVIGSAHDFWTAYREGAFGNQPRPFVGWLILVEDTKKSRCPVLNNSLYFEIFKEFNDTSYLQRYNLLCQKLMKEQLYTSASILASSKDASHSGDFTEISTMTGMKTFVTSLAGHIATVAARLN